MDSNLLQQTDAILGKSDRLAIFCRAQAGSEALAAAAGLLRGLDEKKEVFLICPDSVPDKVKPLLNGVIPQTEPGFLESSHLSLQLPVNIKKLNEFWYEEQNGNAIIHITAKDNSKFKKEKVNVVLNSSQNNATIVVVGLPNLKDLGKVYKENKEFFSANKIINIDNNSQNKLYGDLNLIDSSQLLAEIILELFKNKNLELNKNASDLLLFSLTQEYWRNKVKTKQA